MGIRNPARSLCHIRPDRSEFKFIQLLLPAINTAVDVEPLQQ